MSFSLASLLSICCDNSVIDKQLSEASCFGEFALDFERCFKVLINPKASITSFSRTLGDIDPSIHSYRAIFNSFDF